MSERWETSKQNQFKKLQDQVPHFVKDLEGTLDEFEKKGDIKQLSNKIKDSINEFQKSIRLIFINLNSDRKRFWFSELGAIDEFIL